MNSKTPHSRALRAATARHREAAVIAAGGRNLKILLQPDDAARLARLQKARAATATAVVVAGLEALEKD